MATREDNFPFFPNHNSQLEDALEAGFRGINLDVCDCFGTLSFCHSSCALGRRSIDDVIGHVTAFLDNNPNEVLLITIQMDGRASRVVDINELYSKFGAVDGFLDKLYVHPNPGLAWPTLGTLVNSGKQILLFHFNGPECAVTSCPPGLHDWFKYAAETEFSFSDVNEILHTTTSCEITRGFTSLRNFFGVNNFVTRANEDDSRILNSLNFAEDRIEACSAQQELDVNVLSVDFWKSGEIPEVVSRHNKALVARRRLLVDDA